MPDYISAKDAAAKWGISNRRVSVLCREERIPGAFQLGSGWAIPTNAEKPPDARLKSGKYIGWKRSQAGQKENQSTDKEGDNQ